MYLKIEIQIIVYKALNEIRFLVFLTIISHLHFRKVRIQKKSRRKNGESKGEQQRILSSLWWFSVGICKYKPGYKSHDPCYNSSALIG